MSLLNVENLTCRHGLMTAVRSVALSLEKGDVLCVIGSNGAGKTTLMRALAGAHPAAEGQISLEGKDITKLTAFARVKAGIAMSPEGRRLFPDMTVRENLIIAAENGRTGPWTVDRALDAFPQLVPLIDKLAGGLSGGQRQAAAIARALVANPDLLILDEVSLGLSPAAVEQVYVSLDGIKQERAMGMIIVEQDLNRALGFADQIICISEGRIELSGKPGDFTRDQITDAYFGIKTEDAHV